MEPQLLTVIDKEKLKSWTPSEWRKWWIEPKRDGFRAIFRNGKFQSRTGKPLYNLEHIEAELSGLTGMVLDGEIHGASWAETSSVARASKTKKESSLRFYVFDVMWKQEWDMQRCDTPLSVRRSKLHALFAGLDLKHIDVANQWHGLSYEDFSFIHSMNLFNGCDGTVLKLADSLYEFKRTKTWLKVKPALDIDCYVVGMYEGEGKYKGMLGGLKVIPEGGDTITNVSGMTDDQRKAWWQHPHLIEDKWIEVTYRKMNPNGKLVEPRFERIREDKNI